MSDCKHLATRRFYSRDDVDAEKGNKGITEKVEDCGDDGFAIYGCCGGGCYVINGIKFCPFCGVKLK